MSQFKRFGVWGNTDKDIFWKTLPSIIKWSENKKIQIFLTQRISKHKRGIKHSFSIIKSKNDIKKLDFMLVLGGDGTFLSCARAVGNSQTPILGIHLGDLGFLAKLTLQDYISRLDQLVRKDFFIEKRMVVQSRIEKNKKESKYFALNDFVVSSGDSHRMLCALIYVDSHFVGKYRSDGIIIATPTGSTAYSLSAGGPIVTPKVDSLVITPISAHSLTSRPLVIPANSKVLLKFEEISYPISFIIDGQIHETLTPDSIIQITKSYYKINFINFKNSNYFQMLTKKMGWGKRGEE